MGLILLGRYTRLDRVRWCLEMKRRDYDSLAVRSINGDPIYMPDSYRLVYFTRISKGVRALGYVVALLINITVVPRAEACLRFGISLHELQLGAPRSGGSPNYLLGTYPVSPSRS